MITLPFFLRRRFLLELSSNSVHTGWNQLDPSDHFFWKSSLWLLQFNFSSILLFLLCALPFGTNLCSLSCEVLRRSSLCMYGQNLGLLTIVELLFSSNITIPNLMILGFQLLIQCNLYFNLIFVIIRIWIFFIMTRQA